MMPSFVPAEELLCVLVVLFCIIFTFIHRPTLLHRMSLGWQKNNISGVKTDILSFLLTIWRPVQLPVRPYDLFTSCFLHLFPFCVNAVAVCGLFFTFWWVNCFSKEQVELFFFSLSFNTSRMWFDTCRITSYLFGCMCWSETCISCSVFTGVHATHRAPYPGFCLWKCEMTTSCAVGDILRGWHPCRGPILFHIWPPDEPRPI